MILYFCFSQMNEIARARLSLEALKSNPNICQHLSDGPSSEPDFEKRGLENQPTPVKIRD